MEKSFYVFITFYGWKNTVYDFNFFMWLGTVGKQLPTLWNKKEFQKKGRGSVQLGSEGEVFLELGGKNQLKLTSVTLMIQ